MKRITKIAAFISSLAICAGLSACGSTRSGFEQTGGTQKLEKGATIGISMPTKSEERWNKDGNNLKNKLEDAGYNVVLNYADDKPAQQNADIENMVNQGAKILVVASKDGSAVGPAVEKARDAGATVIAYDRLIMNTDAVDYYATSSCSPGRPTTPTPNTTSRARGTSCSRTSKRACSSARPTTAAA